MERKYKIYPSLLDSFQRYLGSENEEAFQELIDKINRKPFASEAAEKGTALNEIVDNWNNIESPIIIERNPKDSYWKVKHKGFEFKLAVVQEFVTKFKNALSQVFVEGTLKTAKGEVSLYGYVDKVMSDKAHDIKTTGNYVFPKFTVNTQHKVYMYCMRQMGIPVSEFEYNVTDFTGVWRESYAWNEKYIQELINICEHFIHFLESNRKLITDKKIFGL